ERAELVTYDWRFHLRNGLLGTPAMDRRLGTVEIDDQSVEAEGRYQDWTRDKYTEVVRLLHQYGARMLGFDVYFIEPSAKMLTESQLLALPQIDAQSVAGLLARADHDRTFQEAIATAGDVHLALYLGAAEGMSAREVEARMEPLSPDQEEALALIRQRAPRLMVPAEASTLTRAYYFEPPLKRLREAARGFAYAQTVSDVDGARRRYPLVYQYRDVVFPSIALVMVCDYLQVPITQVQVWPGRWIRLPDAHLDSGTRTIEVPIDDRGNMNVNWAGPWEETFVRYPHIALRRAYQREERQQLLDRIKRLVAEQPALRANPRELPQALAQAGVSDPQTARAPLLTWVQASSMEAAIRQNPGLDAAAFWRSKGVAAPAAEQVAMYESIQRHNRVADVLAADPGATLPELQAAVPGADPEEVRQSERYVRGLLQAPGGLETARPIYVYPYVRYQGRRITPEDLEGRILFYGLTSTGSTDLSVTPFQGNYPMVGIYSNVLNTILNESFIRRIPTWAEVLLTLLLGALLSVVVPRLRVLHGAALVAVVVALYALGAFGSFAYAGLWLQMVGPLCTLVVGYLALTIYGYVVKEREKEFVQGAFGHYLSPAVVDHIMQHPEMIDQLGGQERVMSAFFSDIASFSTISEALTPGELVQFINEYLSEMCDIIERAGGTIDKFEGDAVLAFFGAPLYFEDHAQRAVLASIDQQHKLVELRQRWAQDGVLPPRLQELRRRWEAQGRTFAHVRMGVTAGPMIVGNMGSKARTDYTMMGDTVNLAARFESGQKIYGTGIMVNDAIYEAVRDIVETRRLDVIQVVGKEEPVTAYEVLDRKGALSPHKLEVLGLYNEGMLAYSAFRFADALQSFGQALKIDPHDGPSALYADRCEEYILNPPADLVFRAQSK
ncbi:MAG: CHASE2 domain-containing protein, partial [Candidatus Latescibacterota bacterium]